jgi:hypothetical protein
MILIIYISKIYLIIYILNNSKVFKSLISLLSLDVVISRKRSLMKRVNIQLEDETHTKAKVIAVLKDMTLNEYFEKAIHEAVEKDQAILNKIKTTK